MKTRLYTIILALTFLLFFLAACSSSTPAPTTALPVSATALDGAALVQERCTVCHPISRVESARFSAADWKTVVDTMIARGAQLSPQEEIAVVSYLAANYGN